MELVYLVCTFKNLYHFMIKIFLMNCFGIKIKALGREKRPIHLYFILFYAEVLKMGIPTEIIKKNDGGYYHTL